MLEQEVDIFELIDLDSGNVVSDFDSIQDALEAIRRVAKTTDWSSVQRLSLMRVRGDDQAVIAMKERLVTMAQSLETTTAAETLKALRNHGELSNATRGAAATVVHTGAVGARLKKEHAPFVDELVKVELRLEMADSKRTSTSLLHVELSAA
jgi:hypothetical protein